MRSSSYSQFLDRMTALCGVQELLATESRQFLAYFQRNIRDGWERFEFPELCPVEPVVTDVDGVIPLVGSTNYDIDHAFAIWNGDPDGESGGSEVAFRLTPDGIKTNLSQAKLWINYRIRVPEYEGEEWDSAEGYTLDDQVYYGPEGRFYRALLPSTNIAPTNQSYWREIEIPYCLFEYVVQQSFGDALVAEGFDEKAQRVYSRAELILAKEFDKVQRQSRQRPRFTIIRTHGSMQPCLR